MMSSMSDDQLRAGEKAAPVELVVHIPDSRPVTARIGEIVLPVLEDGASIEEGEVGDRIADFLASAADCFRREGLGGDATVR